MTAAHQTSDGLVKAQADREALQRHESRFRLLAAAIERLSTATSREEVLATVFSSARALTGADGVSLVVREGEQCHYLAEDAVGPLWSGQRFPLMSCVSGLAMVEHRTIVIPEVAADARVPHAAYEPTFVKSLLMVPIGNGGGAAAIGAYWARVRTPDAEEVEVLEALSRVAGTRLLKQDAEERLQESEERFRSLVESWAQAVWETDAEGQVIADSPSWRAYTGQNQEEWLGGGWANAIHPDDRAAVQGLWCEAVRERRPLKTEHRLRWAGGGWRWTNVHAAPLLAPDGTVRKWVGMNIDITERKEAEEALRASEERFRQFGEASTDILWIRNANSLQWEYLSPAFEAVYGVSRERALAGDNVRNWAERILPEDRGHALDSIARVRAGERVTFEFRITRPDGQMRWMRDTDFPLLDDTGRVQRIGGIGQDITERKQAEEALRASEGRATLLLGELQHRVRNTLSVIRSITRRTAETSHSVEDYAMHLDGRINAFARVQTAVARDPAAGLGLTDLVADELLTYVAHDGEQVKIAGPAVRLKPKAAETFGLAIHELATNAVKHGALLSPDGRIRVTWWVHNGTDPPRLVFEWKESGTPNRTPKRKRRGFGTDLLERTLTYELKAKTVQTYEPDGLRCTIELPMTERVTMGNSASTPEPD